MEKNNKEKDRENTEKKLLNALGEIILNEGFEKIGINSVAAKAGVSKVLIYRYFASIDNMIIEYLSQNDFWINFSADIPEYENLRDFIKKIFRDQIEQLRNNTIIQKLQRWELNQKNTIIDKVRLKQEAKGISLITIISHLSRSSQEEIATIATILSASITYLVILSENCPQYNGIDIQDDKGWEQVSRGIDLLIDLWCDANKIQK